MALILYLSAYLFIDINVLEKYINNYKFTGR